MKRLFWVLLIIQCLWAASPESLIASFNFESTVTVGVKTLESISLSETELPTLPYEINVGQVFQPGARVTINVRALATTPTTIAVLAFGQKIALQEYADKVWLGYIDIVKTQPRGEYSLRIYLKGTASLNAVEKLTITVDYPIAQIFITGNVLVPSSSITDVLQLKVGDFYNKLKADINRQRILELGYFSRVTVNSVISDNKLIVTYTVSENPIIRSIDVVGSVEFSKEELLKCLVFKPGDLLANHQLQKDVVALNEYYKSKEYMYARVVAVERPTSANNYQLLFRVREAKVRSIEIEGNAVTQKHVIAREMDLKKGDIFNAGKLKEDLRRIYNLNYFSNIEPDIQINEQTDEVDIKVKVEEKKTSSVNFGGGYGQIQGWFGFVDLFLDNIAGTAQSTLFKAQFGDRFTSYQFKYHNPWMWNNKTSFTLKLWGTYGFNYLTGERELRKGWSPSIGFQRSLYVQESYGFRYEDVQNISDRSRSYLDRALIYSISYDDRDQWMNPTKGKYDQFSMDHSSKFLGGSINASRYSLQFNRFVSFIEKQVFASRFMYDYQVGDVFSSEQYYVGSDNTVRGYKDGIFAKGTQRAVFNFEYRYLFTEMFIGVLFYDIGQAINQVYDPLDEERNFIQHRGWGSGMGFGMRVVTPMGPIRLDYGWPQYKEFADGYISFNMGQVF